MVVLKSPILINKKEKNMSAFSTIQKMVETHNIQFVDFRFADINGRWHSITTHPHLLDEETFTEGLNFDGSSVDGWCEIHQSDMFYRPDATSAFVDPFLSNPTLIILCDVLNPTTGEVYNRDPRGIASRAEAYLAKTKLAEKVIMGPELEFFLFDNVAYKNTMDESYYAIDADHGAWNTGNAEDNNNGHIAGVKGGYFQVPPVDRLHDIRSEMLKTLEQIGVRTRIHHHEVATAGQCELGMEADTLKRMADMSLMYKYVVKNVADIYGKTATFMPKPLHRDNGSGMHVHQSLVGKDGKNLFAGDAYAGLSQEALWYIGGIIKHARAINAFTNPSTNSYKRLIPGYEAPVILTYAARNRSASIRIPAGAGEKAKRIEVRFPDPTANPYLAFSAMLMAGLDGIKNKIDPGKAMEENLYNKPQSEVNKIPHVCPSLRLALESLDEDRKFLTAGSVFDDDFIDAYIALKMEEVERLEHTPSPVEFEMYYSS